MSAHQVTRMQLTCDGCGVKHPEIIAPVAAMRARAAADGWKHRAIEYRSSNWLRQVDLCPACVASEGTVERVVMEGIA